MSPAAALRHMFRFRLWGGMELSGTCCVQVPRSAKLVTEDNEYALYSFILFRKIVDSYKSEARQKGWQVCPRCVQLGDLHAPTMHGCMATAEIGRCCGALGDG